MAVLVLLVLLLCITSGTIGYFIAYLQNEKKNKKKPEKYNPKAGWYAYV